MTSTPIQNPSEPAWVPYSHHADSDIGILLSHGFTSGPGSMAHLSQRFAEAGLNVECPLLSGHGTRWQDLIGVKAEDWLRDLGEASQRLKARSRKVFVVGLSLGGSLVLRLAQTDPEIQGVVAINHALLFNNPLVPFAGWLKHLVASQPAIAGDIKDPEAKEVAYDRTPTAGVAQIHRLSCLVRQDWDKLTQPLLVFKSREDHVLPVSNATLTLQMAASKDKELVWLENSYHVATLDYDKDLIAERCLAFFKRVAEGA